MYNRKSGMALVSVIITMVVFMILGTAILAVTYSENKQAIVQKEVIREYYVARSGADSVASYIIENPSSLDKFIKESKNGPIIGEIDGMTFEVYVTGTEHEFVIESTAYDSSGHGTSRIYLTMSDFNLLDFAVFANSSFDTGNNANIKGKLGTNGNSIVFGNSLIDGDIMLGPNALPEHISAAQSKVTSEHSVTKSSAIVNLPLAKPSDFSEALPNGTVNINTANFVLVNGKLTRSLNRIDLSGNDTFYVHGGGQVHILITDSLSLSGNSEISTDTNTQLFLYYNKSDTINFSGTPNSNIVIYAPLATIQYDGGGTGETYGSLICNIFNGPNSSAASITQKAMGAENLMISGTGYYRAIWSK